MKSRQRLLGALRGDAIDRVPWSPFLTYYFENLPKETREQGQFPCLQKMGADPLLRGFHRLTKCVYQNCEIEKKSVGRDHYTIVTELVRTLGKRN